MATFTWILPAGTAGLSDNPADWSAGGPPVAGDTGILTNGGTILFPDLVLQGNTAVLGAGSAVFSGGTDISFVNPTVDQTSIITTATGLAAAASTIDAFGNFVNDGTILANGAAGSTLTINIGTTIAGGITAAGYFYSPDVIEADAGNTLTINIGASSELFNSGEILANGGSILINVSTSAIAGGYAPNLGFAVISAGGTIETQAAYPASFDSTTTSFGTTPFYAFADTKAGNTLKIDNIGSFGGRIFNFQKGDTIDLGASLAITGLAYNPVTGILNLDGAGNVILASLAMANGNFQSTNGTVAPLIGSAAAGFSVGTSGGDTILTATGTIVTAANTSGAWQDPASWIGGVAPGTAEIPVIGLAPAGGAPVLNFALNTGNTAVTVAGFDIVDHHATLDITSNTTATTAVVDDLSGTIEAAAGNTLTAAALRTFFQEASVKVDKGAALVLTGHPSINLASIAGTLSPGTGNTFGAQFGAGTVEVDGALLAGPTTVAGIVTGGAGLSIGYDGNGSVNMTVNGTIGGTVLGTGTVTDTHLTVGSDPTSSGTLTLEGTGVAWTDMLVPGSLDPDSNRGYALIGYNDLSSNTPGTLAPPPPQGAAELIIENGATMTEQEAGFIGYSPNSTGHVTVTAGGVWNMAAAPAGLVITSTVTTTAGSGFLQVGRQGTGTLSVLNGGTVEAGGLGSFLGGGTSFSAGGIQIGQSAGASGSILVSGTDSLSGANALLSTHDGIAVGNSGTGFLSIQNGGSVSVLANGIGVGDTAGAAGSIVIGGTGAAAMLTMGPASGGITVGRAGTGTLEVDSLGTLSMDGTGGIGVGQQATGVGSVIVNGGTLIQSASAGGIGVGQASGASASLLIENSGTVLLQGNGISAATTATADRGTITIESGGLLQTTGTAAINIGNTGTGVLFVSNGGSVSDANALRVGVAAASSGSVTVTNATITAASLVLDAAAGGNANGALTVNAGGVVNTTGAATINQHGFVTLTGGTLNVGTGGGAAGLTINGGAQLTGFGKVAGGAASGITNNGLITASGGTLELKVGAGNMSITSGAELKLDLAGATASTVSFSTGAGDAAETLFLATTPGLTNSLNINSWEPFDTLSFDTPNTLTGASLVNTNTLIVNWSSGAATGSYSFANVLLAAGAPTNFNVSTGSGVGSVTLACFAEGSRIRTAHGLVPVERLLEGDHLLIATGGPAGPIVWIGRTMVDCRTHPDPESVWPVRIAAGAIGPRRPVRDLYLSPDHAVFVNNVLVPVKYLINGTSIAQVRRDNVTYFHVELDRHEVILAEDLPVESYLDAGDRANFGDGGGIVRLHPDFASRLAPSTAFLWETRGAAPLVQAGPALEAARASVTDWEVSRRSA